MTSNANPPQARSFRSRACGFSLIEVLITMVVVSFGLLGVGVLQMKSLQFTHASYQRSLATIQVNDLVERMWAGVCTLDTDLNDIVTEWSDTYDTSLQGWDGDAVLVSGSNPPRYTITLEWSEGRIQHTAEDTSQEAQQFVHTVSLPTLPGCP